MSEPRLFHLIPRDQWRRFRDLDSYTPDSLTSEGFVHLSSTAQVAGTAATFFAGRDDLVLLEVTIPADDRRLRWEETLGPHGVEPFPHFHGALPRDFITSATPWSPGGGGGSDTT